MSRYNPIPVVPGDDWSFSIATVDGDGATVDLSGWTVLSAVVTGSGEPFDVNAEVLVGSVLITASAAVTAQLRKGNVSILTVRIQSVDGTELTVLSEYLNGVPVLGEEVERSIRIVGTNGYSTYELYVQAGGTLSQPDWLADQEENRVAAENAAASALAYKTAAEIAASTTFTNGTIYTTEALGLAAVSNGEQFSWLSADGLTINRSVRVDASTSTLATSIPSQLVIDDLLSRSREVGQGIAFTVSDEKGYSPFMVTDTGGLKTFLVSLLGNTAVSTAGALETDNFKILTISENAGWKWAISDEKGYVAAGVSVDGVFRAAGLAGALEPTTVWPAPTLRYDIAHRIVYGQSLSVGQTLGIVVSPTPTYDNLMFVYGMIPQYQYDALTSADWYASLVAAHEAVSPVGSAGAPFGLAETPCSGLGDMIKERLAVENGLTQAEQSYQVMLSAPGYGAQTLAQLSKGTVHYTRMMDQVQAGLDRANELGKTYGVESVSLIQSENDYVANTSRATWRGLLDQYLLDINVDIKAITGQTGDVHLILYQVASHKVAGRSVPTIALEQAKAARENALIHLATPMYCFDYQSSSNYHLTGASSRLLGGYLGLCDKRGIVDQTKIKPTRIIAGIRQGKVVTLDYQMQVAPLVIDTTQVSAATSYGFEIYEPDGVTPITINSVAKAGPTRVRLLCATTVPEDAIVRYAWTGADDVGRTSGPRGNLRDSQGETVKFGEATRMDGWAIIDEWILT